MFSPPKFGKLRSRPAVRVLAYAWPHRGRLSLHALVAIAIALLELLNPWPMKILVDHVLGSQPVPGWVMLGRVALLLVVVAAGFGLRLLVSGLRVAATYLNASIRQHVVLTLKSELFQHLQRLSFSFHDNRRVGDSIYRISNDAYCVDDIVSSLMPLATACLTLAGMFAIVLRMDWQLALLATAVTPFLYWSVGFYSKKFKPRVQQVQQMEAESMSIVQETLANLRVIKAFTREEQQHQRFLQQGLATMKQRIRLIVQQSMFSVTMGIITAAGTSLVLGVGAYHVLNGALTVGGLLVVLAYLAAVYGPLESISGTLAWLQTYLAKAERVFEVLDASPDVKDEPGAIGLTRASGRVTFDGVSFCYRAGVNPVRDVSFDVPPGQVLGIVGPTGAGKTTLVSLIPRFYDATTGRVRLDGVDVRRLQLKSLRQQISLVFQEPILFSDTIRENISHGLPNASSEQIIAAARAANAHEFIVRLPEQYDTQVGERGVKLSGGERQRISIARAFLKDAPILILDEPTAALDSQTEAGILEALERLMHRRTTFIIAHRLSTLRTADRILVLDHGRIVEEGSHEELRAAGGLYHRMHELQFGLPETGEVALGGARL